MILSEDISYFHCYCTQAVKIYFLLSFCCYFIKLMKKREKGEGLGSNTSEISPQSVASILQAAKWLGTLPGYAPLHRAESQS